jgi:hypothetical protein
MLIEPVVMPHALEGLSRRLGIRWHHMVQHTCAHQLFLFSVQQATQGRVDSSDLEILVEYGYRREVVVKQPLAPGIKQAGVRIQALPPASTGRKLDELAHSAGGGFSTALG